MGKICAVCGKEIPSTRKSNRVKYCSEKCAREAQKKQQIHRIADRANRLGSKRWDAYWRYDFRCALCGWRITEERWVWHKGKMQYSRGLEVHHIVPVAEGGTEEEQNLIVLCPNCHKKADWGLISRGELKEHTFNSFQPTEEEKLKMICDCSDRITEALFGK